MVCPNCGSSEVIAVQGEKYCISCGQLMPKNAPEVSTDGLPEGVKILPVASPSVDKPKRAKLGRPKAGPMDRPAAITHKIVSNPSPVYAQAAPKVAPVTQPIPLEPATTRPKSVMQDVVRRPAPHRTAQVPKLIKVAGIAYSEVLAASLRGRWNERRVWPVMVPAAIVVILATIAGLIVVGGHSDRLMSVAAEHPLLIGGELTIIALIYYLTRSLSHAAVIFGSARLDDHRPLKASRWLLMAAASQPRRLLLDITGGAVLAFAASLGFAVYSSGLNTNGWPEALQAITLMAAYLTLLYLATAVAMAVSLGHVAVTLAPVSANTGLGLGWRLFRRHFELAGARLAALVVEVIGLLLVTVGAGGWLVVAPNGLKPTVIIVAGVVLAFAGGLAGAGSAIWWQAAYRRLVSADHPSGFHRLLAAATPRAPQPRAVGILVAALGVLSVAVLAWPFLIS